MTSGVPNVFSQFRGGAHLYHQIYRLKEPDSGQRGGSNFVNWPMRLLQIGLWAGVAAGALGCVVFGLQFGPPTSP
eukprot:SAG31_NODE_5638_length_2410_cov_2.118131_3_plen_75_part_00